MTTSLRNVLAVAGIALLIGAGGTNLLKADTTAYTTTPVTETDLAGYGLSGIEFTLNQNITVTQLGFTGLAIGGGDTPHVSVFQVGSGLSDLTPLYDTGNIVGSVVSTNPGTNSGAPSFVAVTSTLTLTAGNTYLISAPAYWAATHTSGGVSTLDGAVFGSSTFLTGGGWTNWDNSSYNFAALAPSSSGALPTVVNFQFNVAAVPEPSTYLMFGLSAAFLLFVLRRRSVRA